VSTVEGDQVAASPETTTPARPDRRPARTHGRGGRGAPGRLLVPACQYLALAGVTVLFLYPLVWLVSASLKPRAEVFDNRLVPRDLAPHNYVEVWQAAPVLTWLGNSAVVGVMAAVAATLSSALVAFGFAFLRFRGREALFGLVLSTMMLPGVVTMVPTFLIWDRLGLVGTQVPLWAQNLFGSAFYIFMLRQFFRTVPRDLIEAALLDGAGYPRIFRSIALPLAKPALIIVFIFELRASWTDLVKPLIYLRDPALFTIPRGLKAVVDQFGQGGELKWEVILAASVITTVPMLVLFLVAQRYFVEGIATTGRGGN
jgi:multiple sugar transport system permease protein